MDLVHKKHGVIIPTIGEQENVITSIRRVLNILLRTKEPGPILYSHEEYCGREEREYWRTLLIYRNWNLWR